MSQATLNRTLPSLGLRQIAIIVLTVATGLVHLSRGIMTSAVARPAGRLANRIPSGAGRFPNRPPGGLGFSIMSYLPLPLSTLFYLNFVGYIVLAIAFFLPALQAYRRVIRWVMIIYAAATITMWFLITGGMPNVLAYIDKPIEVALIVLLIIDDVQASREHKLEQNAA